MDFTNQIILVAGLLFLSSILATLITPRLGAPLLLVFLAVGMLAGEDGPGGIVFEDYRLAHLAGTAALAVILFDGGMRTHMATFRVGLKPALSLATIGVLITTAIAGTFSAWILEISWAEGLLIGAIVGSTDAAAVFSVLHTNAVRLNERLTSVLEIESGTNDPMAVFLTLALLDYLLGPEAYAPLDAALLLIRQMGLGAALGIGGGYALVWALNNLELSDSLYALLALFSGLLVFGATAVLGGSGFLAVYLAGIVLGNRPVRAFASIRRFHDGIAWMAQIGMFVILGLLVTPSHLLAVAGTALLIALVLIVIARPLATLIALAPLRFPWKEQVLIAWVGLRGSVPIVLATYPLLTGLENAELFFNIAFFIVLVSLVMQGWTLAPAARLLGLQMPETTMRATRVDFDLPGTRGYEIVSYRIAEDSPLIGRKAWDLGLPGTSRIICTVRRGRVISSRESGALRAGDYVALLAAQDELPQLDAFFLAKRRAPRQLEEEARYFGEFLIDPKAPVSELAQVYGFELPPGAQDRRAGEFFTSVIPNPVVGDRLRLGQTELVVKKMEGGQIREIGLRLPH